MRMMVLTSCTGQKATSSPAPLELVDFDDDDRLRQREEQLACHLRPASVMYTGQQHVRAMRGVRALRSVLGPQAVQVAIVSAGYGVVGEDRLIAHYDVTFSGMSATAIRQRAGRLAIPVDVRTHVAGHDLVFVLLGSTYLTAVDPPLPEMAGQQLIYFARPGEQVSAAGVLVPAGKAEAARYGAGLVALKGRMLELLGAAVVRQGVALLEAVRDDPTPRTVMAALDAEVAVR